MTASLNRDAGIDLDRVIADTFVTQARFYETVDSTNRAALESCHGDDLQTPLLVVAAQQTCGRGRGSNKWWSARGALTFSVVVRPVDMGITENMWPQVSLTTGLSVCLALDGLLTKQRVLLKWPNDVYADRRKICGVLVEVGPRSSETLVIGIGINVNNSFQSAPEELQSHATSMIDVAKKEFDLSNVLMLVLRQLETQLARLVSEAPGLAAEWQQRCALLGRTVAIDTGTGTTTGVCQGIDSQGALVLLTEGGPARFFGGTVARVL